MAKHKVVSSEEWVEARTKLLVKERSSPAFATS
jgi:predicted dithiol-disulfide oxidoreductase (DUF899 family)